MDNMPLDRFIALWSEAVRAYLDSPLGKNALRSLDAAVRPVFVALLETFLPPIDDKTLNFELGTWKKAREKSLRAELNMRLYASYDERMSDLEMEKVFRKIFSFAYGVASDVKSFWAEMTGVKHLITASEAVTVMPDARPTRPVLFDEETLELVTDLGRESAPDSLSLAALEDRLSRTLAETTAPAVDVRLAVRPPSGQIESVGQSLPRPAQTPSWESFGFKPKPVPAPELMRLDDPLESSLDPGRSHPPDSSPCIEMGESRELDDELEFTAQNIVGAKRT